MDVNSIPVILSLFTIFILHQAESNPVQHRLWQPDGGVNRTEWMGCHGLNCNTWKRVKQKMARYAAIQVAAGLVPASASRGNPNRNWLPPDIALDEDLDSVDGCIKLTEEQIDELTSNLNNYLYNRGKRRRKRKVLNFSKLTFRQWTDFPIKYKFDGKHRQRELELIRSAVRHWEAQTCIRFQEIPVETDLGKTPHLLFTREGTGCHSFIGKVPIIPQQLNLQYTCLWEFGIPVHEIGHALGFWHEHQRWDRDADIKVYWDNVGYYTSQYYKQPTESLGVPYDIGSVMHYGPRDGSINGQNVMETKDPLYQKMMGQKTGLSFLDTKAMNMAYCSTSCAGRPLARQCERGGYQDPNDCSKCKCPDGFDGPFCGSLAPPKNAQCGGYLTATGVEQFIQSPNYLAGSYEDYQECSWMILAPPGHRVKFRFVEQFGMFCYKQEQCHHWVEIKYKRPFSYPGPRFCCYDRPTAELTSATVEMLVIMKANWTTFLNTFRLGFKAGYIAVRQDGSPADIVPAPTPVPLPTIPLTPRATPRPPPPPTQRPTQRPPPPPTPVPPTRRPPPTPAPWTPPPPTRAPWTPPPPTRAPWTPPPPTPAPWTPAPPTWAPWTPPPPTPAPWTPPPPTPAPVTFAPPPQPTPTPVPFTPAPPTSQNKDCRRLDVAFVLDSSGSIGARNWQLMLNFVKDVAQRFVISPYDVRIGVITYGNVATLDIRFGDYFDVSSLMAAVDRIPWKDQWTNTSGALWVMREYLFNLASGDRPGVPDYCVLVTDGEANLDGHRTMHEADLTIRRGIKTIVVGIGDKVNPLEAAGIAMGSGVAHALPSGGRNAVVDNVVSVRDFQEFISIDTIARVVRFLCPSYATNTVTRGTPAPLWSWFCSFEDQLQPICGMSQDPNDQFDFTRWTGTTPSEVTGPEAAYAGRYYIYIEASNPRREGDRAIIRLPYFNRRGPHCLRFFYHMYGYHIRSLEVFVQGTKRTIFPWQKSLQQGNEWLPAAVNVYLEPSDVVGFAATRGAEYSGDIALDELSITDGQC